MAAAASTPVPPGPTWLAGADRFMIMPFARVVDAVAVALLVGNLGVVFTSVLFRYLLHAPFEWADDVPRVMLIGLTFVGGAAALGRGQHAGITILLDRVPLRWRGVLSTFGAMAAVAVSAAIAWNAVDLAASVEGQETAGGLAQGWFVYPMAFGAFAMVVFGLRGLAVRPLRDLVSTCLAMAALAAALAAWSQLSPETMPAPLSVLTAAFVVALAVGTPIAYALGFASLCCLMADPAIPLQIMAQQASAGVDNFVLLAVPFFILTGYIMEVNGLSIRLIELIQRGIGKRRGGLNIVMVVSMLVFSGISGSKLADVAAVGSVLIPAARKSRQDPSDAVGLLAASAVMAEVIPPCVNLIILGFVANISISGLFLAGLLPAALLALALGTVAVLTAPRGAQEVMVETGAGSGQLVRSAFACTGMILIIFVGFRAGLATATEISAFAAVYALLAGGLLFREMTWRGLFACLTKSALLSGLVLLIIALAQTFAFLLTIYQVPHALAESLINLAAQYGAWAFIGLSMLILIVMGAVLEGAAALIIFGPLLVPVALQLGINPLHFGILLVLAMGIGLFSPPLGLGLYACCAIGNVSMESTTLAMAKYLGILMLGLMLLATFPALTLLLPKHFGF